MTNNETLIPIPGRLHSVATEGQVAGADEIYDDSLQKDQATINQEVSEALGEGGTVDEKIAAAVNALDATKSQTAGTDGLALSITEVDGKITSISGSIAANTYDANGAASTAKSEVLGSGVGTDYNTLKKIEDKLSPIETAVGTGGSVDTRIINAINAEKTRAQGVENALDDRVDNLEVSVGTGGSVDSRISTAVATETTRAQEAEANRYTKSETYTKEEVNNLITTPNQEYVSVIATSETTSATDVLPATGAANTVYRVGNWDGTQYNDSVFSEYAWNGSAYIKLSTKSQIGEVYDISANHADTKYEDLAAALGTNGANVPVGVRKGGMSVKFVQSSDNMYVQYFLKTTTFSIRVEDWEYDVNVSSRENIEEDFVSVTLDPINRMTESLSKEGVKRFYGSVNVEDDFYTKGSLNVGKTFNLGDNIQLTSVDYIPGFIKCLVDADNKIIWGVKNDGNVFYGAGVSSQIKEYVEEYVASVLQKNTLEEIPISFVQTGMNGSGEETSTSNTHITTQKIYGKGYYLIIMPDELKCEYNVYNYNTSTTSLPSRFNISSVTPCSHYIDRENDFARVCFSAKDGSELIIGSLPDSIKNNIHIYRLQKSLSKNYDVTVAASDSREYDKMRADIVLDGTNDTEILASLFGSGDSIKILLYGGNYIINKFYTVGDYNKVALPFNVFRYTGNVSNIGQNRIKYTIDGYAFGSGYDSKSIPTFVVTEELHNSIDDSEYTYSIISAPNITNSPDYSGMGRATLEMNNLYVFGWYYDKAIIYVDASRFDSAALNNVNVRSYYVLNTYEPFHITPKEGLVGIRVGFGSNFGILNYVKHCNIWYCYIGVSCVGEHYIFEDVKTHHDYIGFAFGDISTHKIMEHPNMMIGCSIEACYRYMLLTKRGLTEEGEFVRDYNNGIVESTLYCIGLSTEGIWATPYIAKLESDSELPASPNIDDTYKIGNTYKQWNGSTWITLTDVNPHTLGVLEIKKGMYNGLINGDDIFAADEDSCKHMEIQCYRGNTTYVRKSSNLNENWNGTF